MDVVGREFTKVYILDSDQTSHENDPSEINYEFSLAVDGGSITAPHFLQVRKSSEP